MEQWRDIPGYENLYQASTEGRIRTCEGKTTSSAKAERRVWKQRIIKQKYKQRSKGSGKDARVCLWKDGKERTHLVSRLVAATWCDGYAEGLTVNHIDGNPENNNADNLEWVTYRENIIKAFMGGQNKSSKKCSLVADNGEITTFYSMSEASRSLGRHHGYISELLSRGITYLHDGRRIVTY